MKAIALLFVAALSSQAALIPCAATVANVASLTAGHGCTLDGETFDNFRVDWSVPFTSVDISITSAEDIGEQATLDFTVVTVPGSTTASGAWIRMIYHVTSPFAIDDVDLTNVVGNGVRIYESVCTGIIQGGVCFGNWLAQFSDGPGQNTLASFSAVSSMDIEKFMQFNDAFITSFSNATSAPEPEQFLLVGSGLLLVALAKIRKHYGLPYTFVRVPLTSVLASMVYCHAMPVGTTLKSHVILA